MVLYLVNALLKFSSVMMQTINCLFFLGVAVTAFRRLSALLNGSVFHALYRMGGLAYEVPSFSQR